MSSTGAFTNGGLLIRQKRARCAGACRLGPSRGVRAGPIFRVWAPKRSKVEVVLDVPNAPSVQLSKEQDGYFSGLFAEARTGQSYRLRLDGNSTLFPDPVFPDTSRKGRTGPSQNCRSLRVPLDRCETGKASAPMGRSSTRCTSAPLRKKGPGPAQRSNWKSSRGWALLVLK